MICVTDDQTVVKSEKKMAKKSTRKSSSDVADAESNVESLPDTIVEETVTATEEVASTRPKAKSSDDGNAAGNVGISDIRKAVAFVNSVGGLDKAHGLLQILKVAKEVQ